MDIVEVPAVVVAAAELHIDDLLAGFGWFDIFLGLGVAVDADLARLPAELGCISVRRFRGVSGVARRREAKFIPLWIGLHAHASGQKGCENSHIEKPAHIIPPLPGLAITPAARPVQSHSADRDGQALHPGADPVYSAASLPAEPARSGRLTVEDLDQRRAAEHP